MRKVYVSNLDCDNRWYHVATTALFLGLFAFALFLHTHHYDGIAVTPFEKILAPILILSIECLVLYHVLYELLSAFNVFIIKDSHVTYIDTRRGYSNFEYEECILSKNKNRTIEVAGTLFIQPLMIYGKKKDIRSYTIIGTHPPFDGKKFILSNDQIIMRESSVFVSALKESFECVEAEPVIMDADEIKNYFV